MPGAFAVISVLAALLAFTNDLAMPQNWPVERLAPTAPQPWATAGTCDFGVGGISQFRCGIGAEAEIQEAGGQRIIVTGPLRITLGRP